MYIIDLGRLIISIKINNIFCNELDGLYHRDFDIGVIWPNLEVQIPFQVDLFPEVCSSPELNIMCPIGGKGKHQVLYAV